MLFLPAPFYFWMLLQERKEMLKGFIFLFPQLQNDYSSDTVISFILRPPVANRKSYLLLM